ncbi:NUDIX domain-containing protein [Lacibacter luteus]|uniref:NUDIX domain-containing protein n=1 Tax=Lacibacter luteus TaxID=2508719 RepID=A0A4Q1CPD0_9BACT|nr:NUDIX domain-containing protein [Lacibacter luteus]RXK62734.1 NUDIX domain-containing protein [Lacibacter luteus]
MKQTTALYTVGLLHINDRKLLLAFSNNKQCYYLPGGKVDEDETAITALLREIAEELNVQLTENNLEYYTHISAPAFGEANGTIMEQDCYLLDTGFHPQPSAEIGAVHYFTLEEYLQQPVTAPGAVMILQQLQANGLID